MVAAVAVAASFACSPQPGLGRIALARGGKLHVIDTATCRDRVLGRSGRGQVRFTYADESPRFSRDGRRLLFVRSRKGNGKLYALRGGVLTGPLLSPGYSLGYYGHQKLVAVDGLVTRHAAVGRRGSCW